MQATGATAPAFRFDAPLGRPPDIGDLLREIDRDRSRLGIARPGRGVRTVSVPGCAVTNQGLPAPCSQGYEQFRDATNCAEPSPEPAGRDLAEEALPGPPVTHPDTIRPHLGPKMMSHFFSNLTI